MSPETIEKFRHAAVAGHEKLRRGQVWCRKCGHTQIVDSVECLRSGWPKHCGYTMTIDAPNERPASLGAAPQKE